MSEAHKILIPRYHLEDSDSSLVLNDDEVFEDIVIIQRQSKRNSMCHHLFFRQVIQSVSNAVVNGFQTVAALSHSSFFAGSLPLLRLATPKRDNGV